MNLANLPEILIYTDISEPLYDFWVNLTTLNVKNMQSETSQLLYGTFFSSQNQIFFFFHGIDKELDLQVMVIVF